MLALLGLVLHAMTVEAARWEGADGLDVVSGEVVEAGELRQRMSTLVMVALDESEAVLVDKSGRTRNM